jgi:hypothetical protein
MNRAIIYIASGQQYIDEASRSARSVNGQYPTILCTPDDMPSSKVRDCPPFDGVCKLVDNSELPFTNYKYWYMNFIEYLNRTINHYSNNNLGSVIDQFLLLDTDTFICGDLTDFFTALDRFDIVGTQAIGRETMLQRDDIPTSFPELHVGALAFNRNSRIEKLFELWLKLYQDDPEFYGNNDQGPLREALWKSPDVRLGILPTEFCFRYRWGGLINGQVRVLHGRENNTPYEQIAKEVNGSNKIRVYQKRELA